MLFFTYYEDSGDGYEYEKGLGKVYDFRWKESDRFFFSGGFPEERYKVIIHD